jgi:hypothetical protein
VKPPNFILFGLTHGLILLSIPAIAGSLTRWSPPRAGRIGLGIFLLVNELACYGYKAAKGWFAFPAGLPLRQAAFEFAFFTGLTGTTLAVLTPDLWEPFPSYDTVYFFLVHCGIVITLLYLWWSRQARPRPGCVWRVMFLLNAYALFLAGFNWLFRTNYMYLCHKPGNASPLDFFGPWPWYLLAGELIALAGFTLLSLPFRRQRQP